MSLENEPKQNYNKIHLIIHCGLSEHCVFSISSEKNMHVQINIYLFIRLDDFPKIATFLSFFFIPK